MEGLVDKRAYLNTFGCLLKDISLIDDIDRPLDRSDFNTESFYELLFVSIYNLTMQGCTSIDEFSVDSYLSNYKEQYEIFQENNGIEYLSNARNISSLDNYDYYYHRLRKYALLRYYESKGLDTRDIYDSTVVDSAKANQEQQKFDNYSEQDIINSVELDLVINPNTKYCTNTMVTEVQAGAGMSELVKDLMEVPDVGLPLNNDGLNTVVRGARLGCLFMRSAGQGVGKSRLASGDACKISIPYYYDLNQRKYVYTGICEPTVYFTTEMKIDEIQTLFIAAVSKVNEEHILYGQYEDGEYERVKQAIQYIKESPLYIIHIPDFSIEDIKNQIKKFHREFSVNYFFFDYIHTSLKIMSEINGKTGMGLKEHQLLLVFATELKNIAQQLDVFIYTASQLNGEAQNAQYKDQNLLAGSKALANKLDVGIISMRPSKAELKRISSVLHKIVGCPVPNMCHWVYKIRRGRITQIIIWTRVDLGTMTEKCLFVTNYDFDLVEMDFTKIEQVEKKIQEHSIPLAKIKDEANENESEDIDTDDLDKTEGNKKASWGEW